MSVTGLGALLNGEATATDFRVTGLPGASGVARFVGVVDGAAPTWGYFSAGDFVVDVTGAIWVCTGGGNPGTWVRT
jgi:hypothetical protein